VRRGFRESQLSTPPAGARKDLGDLQAQDAANLVIADGVMADGKGALDLLAVKPE